MTGRQGEWPRRVGWGVPESWGVPERRGWYYPEWSELGQVQAKSWCGTGVIHGLVDAIEMHIANTWWSRQRPLVIGTCPWLTDFAVARYDNQFSKSTGSSPGGTYGRSSPRRSTISFPSSRKSGISESTAFENPAPRTNTSPLTVGDLRRARLSSRQELGCQVS